MRRALGGLVAASLLLLVLAAPAAAAQPSRDGSIVDTAIAVNAQTGEFDTLIAAVQAAGLVEALDGRRQFTVFAPTDAAFAKVPKATLDALAADKAKLRSVLLYHVAKGRLTASRVVRRRSVRTLNGQRVRVRVRGSRAYVGGARVTSPDVGASNGVIHVINRVLIPR